MQLIEQGLGLFQVKRVEAFGEPAGKPEQAVRELAAASPGHARGARGLLGRLKAGRSRSPPPPSLLLLLDALDRDDAEAGVFAANVRLKRLLFVIERLERVHIREL